MKIPAGVDTGTRVRLAGEGEPGDQGGPPGDLYVVVHVREHPLFVREDYEVLCEVPISFTQAALGAQIDVPTLDGKVKMKIPAGTQTGKVFRLKGKGIPHLHGGGRGDQHVRVLVETPTDLSAEQRELLEKFAEISGEETPPPVQDLLRQGARALRLVLEVGRARGGMRAPQAGEPAVCAPVPAHVVRPGIIRSAGARRSSGCSCRSLPGAAPRPRRRRACAPSRRAPGPPSG